MKSKSLKMLKKFLHAQKRAERAGLDHFECPICHGEAEWFRNKDNNHLRVLCNDCTACVNE